MKSKNVQKKRGKKEKKGLPYLNEIANSNRPSRMPHKVQLRRDRNQRGRSPIPQILKQRMKGFNTGAKLAIQQRIRMRGGAVAKPIDGERRIALLVRKLLVGVLERHVPPRGAVPVLFRVAGAMGQDLEAGGVFPRGGVGWCCAEEAGEGVFAFAGYVWGGFEGLDEDG